MPRGTPIVAARTKPPTTRQIVSAMSFMKPCCVSRIQPSRSIDAGSARKVGETKPPKVAAAKTAKKSTKNATPSAMRAPGVTGLSGVKRLLDVARIDGALDRRHRLDDADLDQELPRFLEEALQLGGEELLVRRATLPAEIRGRFCEGFARLLHVGAHDLVGLLRLARDHVDRLEVALGDRLRHWCVLGEVFRGAAERVHHHRVVEGGADDLAGLGFRGYRRDVGLVGHHRVVLPGKERLRRRAWIDRHHRYVLRRQSILAQHPRHHEVRRGAGRLRADLLALEIGDLGDVVARDHAVGAVALVHLENLFGRHAVGVPHEPGLGGCGGGPDVARRNPEVARLLRNLLDGGVDAVLLEDAGLLSERDRREAGPAADADVHLGVLRHSAGRQNTNNGGEKQASSCGLPLAGCKKVYPTGPEKTMKRVRRAPRGTAISARSWLTEAPLRMLMNNLDPEVAERPEDLVVYGGIGRAARNWECYDAIVASLRKLNLDETLLVQSGKPVGIFRTHADSPRVLIANCNLVTAWANSEYFNELDRKGLMMYGQMTAGSWIYIGSQGIVQGTYETFAEAGRQHYGGGWSGKWILTAGLGGMGGAQPLAATMAGASMIAIECDPSRIEMRLRSGYLDAQAKTIDEAAALLANAKGPISIGLLGNAAELVPEFLRRARASQFKPALVTDQTSAHDPANGYLPEHWSLDKW